MREWAADDELCELVSGAENSLPGGFGVARDSQGEVKRPRSPMPSSRAPAAAKRARKCCLRSPVTSSSSEALAVSDKGAGSGEDDVRLLGLMMKRRRRGGDYSDTDDTDSPAAVLRYQAGAGGGGHDDAKDFPGAGDAEEAAEAARARARAGAGAERDDWQEEKADARGGSQFMPDWDDAGILLLLNAAEELEQESEQRGTGARGNKSGSAGASPRAGLTAAALSQQQLLIHQQMLMQERVRRQRCGAVSETGAAAASASAPLGGVVGGGLWVSQLSAQAQAQAQAQLMHPVAAALESSKLIHQRYSAAAAAAAGGMVNTHTPSMVLAAVTSFREAVARAVEETDAVAAAAGHGTASEEGKYPYAASEEGTRSGCGGEGESTEEKELEEEELEELEEETRPREAMAATSSAGRGWGDAADAAAAEDGGARSPHHSHVESPVVDVDSLALQRLQRERLLATAHEQQQQKRQQQRKQRAAAASPAAGGAPAKGAMPGQPDIFIQQLATRANELYMVLGPHEIVVQTLMALAVACHWEGYAADTELALNQLWEVVRASSFPGGLGETEAAMTALRGRFEDMVKRAMSDHNFFNGLC